MEESLYGLLCLGSVVFGIWLGCRDVRAKESKMRVRTCPTCEGTGQGRKGDTCTRCGGGGYI